MRTLRSRVMAGIAAGLASAAVLNWLVFEEEYTSTATVRVAPSQIPERFAPADMPLDLHSLVSQQTQTMLSRNTLTAVIQNYDLFRSERSRVPMEDVVDLMRSKIEVRPESQSSVRVSVRYRDRQDAQRVCRDMVSRLVGESARERESRARSMVAFLEDELRDTGRQWDEATKTARASNGSERAMVERDLARKRYEALHQKLADAKSLAGLEMRRQGPTLELLDPPTLPERATGWSRLSVLGAGAGLGLLVPLLAEALRQALRQRGGVRAVFGEARG